MAVKKIITSIVPSPEVKHFLQTPEASPIFDMIAKLSRLYKAEIISHEKYKDKTTVITKTVYKSREISDEFDMLLYQAFPFFAELRDQYNKDNNIVWTVEYEDA